MMQNIYSIVTVSIFSLLSIASTHAQTWDQIIEPEELDSEFDITTITDINSIGDRIFISGFKANLSAMLYYSDDQGETWNTASFQDSTIGFTIFTEEASTVYAFGFDVFGNRGIRKSTNKGESWETVYTTINGLGFAFVAEHMARKDDHLIVANVNSRTGIYKSTDGGSNWSSFDEFETDENLEFEELYVVGDSFYMMVEEDGLRIYRSHLSDTKWELYQSHAFPDVNSSSNQLDDINAAIALPSGRLVLITSSGVRYSDDNGLNWSLLLPEDMGLRTNGILWGSQHLNNEVMMGFIGTRDSSNNVFLLNENFDQSTDITAGLDSYTNINRFALLGSTNTSLFARLQGETKALYRYTKGNVNSVSNLSDTTPQSFLDQNVPNPIRSLTHITFRLPDSDHINLSVYNTQGKLLQTLATGFWPKGEHRIAFHASELPAGVYWYTLTTAMGQWTRKMLIE